MRVSIDERLARLCADFSVAKIGEWLERKFASYDTSKADVISIAENKNDKEYFKSARLLGYVRDLPDGRSGTSNRPLLVAAVEMRKILTERTSCQAQFNFAKRVLQNAVRSGAAGSRTRVSVRRTCRNGLFFHPVKGIIPLFDTYEFTIDENNADDAGSAFPMPPLRGGEAARQSLIVWPNADLNCRARCWADA